MKARYLIDKSALARMPLESVAARLEPILTKGLAASCAIIDLEILYSARNAQEHQKTRLRRSLAYHKVPMSETIFQRALDVQGMLAKSGQHRLPIQDLLIAATAEVSGLILLHYDADFDRISAITGQVCEWVVPRGSV